MADTKRQDGAETPAGEAEGRKRPFSDQEIAGARNGSTPDAMTIIDPSAPPVRRRRIRGGHDVS